MLEPRQGNQLICRTIACVVLLASTSCLHPRKGPPTPGLENVLQVTDTVYSGGRPQGGEAFRSLKERGVTIVVSVDGAPPDVAAAKRHGLRYVHIPLGYGGVSKKEALALVKLSESLGQGVYVHCHHGRHRGPVAAAIACMAAGGFDSDDAHQLLARAGTSKDYAGLWHDMAAFEPPPPGTPLPDLVETADVDPLAEAMVAVDNAWEQLKSAEKRDWSHGGLNIAPHQQALLLYEGFFESARNLPDGHPSDLYEKLKIAVQDAKRMQDALKSGDTTSADAVFETVATSCKQCHKQHRD
jgi:protein tyrosine phosphatase (PTP) superfamily phosphohydrolase (DUF442 family)